MTTTSVPNSHHWPLWWRLSTLFNLSLYNFLGNAFTAGVTPLFGMMVADLHCSFNQTSHLATYALLSLGLSNILALPAAALLGKRYAVLVSLVIFFATNIWTAKAPTYNQVLATRFVGGLSGGVIEAIGPLIVYETFPEKSLSKAMVVYISSLASGAVLGPLFSGLIAGGTHSWRWFFWLLAIASGFNLLTSFVMLPESSYPVIIEEGTPAVWNEKEEQQIEQVDIRPAPDDAVKESASWNFWRRVWLKRSFYNPWASMTLKDLVWNPIRTLWLLISPPVLLAVLLYGQTIAWSLVASVIVAVTFQSPPHLWSATAMGIFGVSGLVGIILGIPFGGALSDYLSVRSSRRHNGVHCPESRLPALIFPALICPAGLLVVGLTLASNHIWIGEAVGTAMISFGGSSTASTTLSYAIDSFPERSLEISMLVNVCKNIIGFGLSYGAVPWFQQAGYKSQFGTMAGLSWFTYVMAIPMYFYGQRVRRSVSRIIRA